MADRQTVIVQGSRGGLGFTGALTLLFVALKLLGRITWPWLWVVSPLWIAAALIVLALVVVFGVAYLAVLRDDRRAAKARAAERARREAARRAAAEKTNRAGT